MSGKKKLRIAIGTVVGVLLLVLLAGIVILHRELNRISYEETVTELPVIDPEFANENGFSLPEGEAIYDADILNVLFLGTDYQISDGDHGRADSNILCSLDLKKGNIRLVSFERGIGVPIPGHGSDLLTHAYQWGGPELSQSIISQMFRVDINGYAQVDFGSFAEIIDAIGGVDVELTELEAKALNGEVVTNAWTEAEVHEGWNHLNGHDALEYCRLRFIDSDWNRQQRQRTVLKQMQAACHDLSPVELVKLADTVLPMIHTNLSRPEVLSVIQSLPKLARGSVTQLQVPDKNSTEGYIRCVTDYESKKIANFLYDAGYEIQSPY